MKRNIKQYTVTFMSLLATLLFAGCITMEGYRAKKRSLSFGIMSPQKGWIYFEKNTDAPEIDYASTGKPDKRTERSEYSDTRGKQTPTPPDKAKPKVENEEDKVVNPGEGKN